jgi:hypothetical protein
LKQEFGFTTPGAADAHQSPRPREATRETQMVTGDLNAAFPAIVRAAVDGRLPCGLNTSSFSELPAHGIV